MANPHYEKAQRLHARGRMSDARAACEACVRTEPTHFGAWTLLGMLHVGEGHYAAALQAFARAAELQPDDLHALGNLGAAQMSVGEHVQATATFRRSTALFPNEVLLHHNLALALHRSGDLEAAEASYASAAALEPARAVAHRDRASALEALGRLEEALACAERAVALDPRDALAHFNLGVILQRLERNEEAAEALGNALELNPQHAETYNNLGIVLKRLGHSKDAIACFDRALLLQPILPDAHNNRGLVLLDLGHAEAALACFDRALALDPDFALALHGRASVLMPLKRYEQAAQGFARLVDVAPNFDYAQGALFLARMYCADWKEYAEHVERLRAAVRSGARVCQPFAYLSVSDDAAEQRRCAESFVAAECPPSAAPLSEGVRYAHERLRIAYLSADLHDHATAYLLAELLECHDRERFEIMVVSFGPPSEGAMRARLRAGVEHFFDWHERTDRNIAEQLRALEVDIAIDLKGYTQDARPGVFAFRPAPLQASFLGYPGTSAAPYIDYLVADATLVPPEHAAHYSECIAYLPDSYQPNDSQRAIAQRTPTRAELDLPDGGFVFCSFNDGYKIAPAVFECWMRLLGDTPGSVLWLLQTNEAATRNLRAAAEAQGIDAERLVFAPRLPLPEHLARQRCADLFLDTLPVNAHTTASDALWAGLPLVTCRGQSFVARVAASLLTAVGLPELVTDSLEAYTALALALAHDPARLAALRERLAHNRASSPLFDAARFCRHFESALLHMHARQREGLPPETFRVG